MAHLIEPLHTKKLYLSNRLIMPPLASAKATNDGYVSEKLLDYYNDKSKGGYISLVIIEYSYVSMEGKACEKQLSLADDSVIDGLKKLVETLHNNGSKAVFQINHAGSKTKEKITGMKPVGPSNIENPLTGITPKELSKSDIEKIKEDFAKAGYRAKKAGADGVELHSAHGYLLNQFLSPITNKRTDEYGGSLENRLRLHLEIIEKMRELVGEDYPIFVRLGACDYMDGGTTEDEGVEASKLLEHAGIDFLDVSGGMCCYDVKQLPQEGYFSPLTNKIKNEVSVPVILTGGIKTVDTADKFLCENTSDLIGVGRPILQDSCWAKNAIESFL